MGCARMTIDVQKPTASVQVPMQALGNMDAEVMEYDAAMQTIRMEYYASMGILVMDYRSDMTLTRRGGASIITSLVCSTGVGEVYVLLDKDSIPILTVDGGYIFLEEYGN